MTTMWRQRCLILFLLLGFVPRSCRGSGSSTETEAVTSPSASSDPTIDNKNNNNDNKDESSQSCRADLQRPDGTCQAAAGAVNSSSTANSNDKNNNKPIDCGLYLAPSSIPMSGWGMYTGKDIRANDIIPPVDVVIPCVDHARHRNLLTHFKRLEITLGDHTPIFSTTGPHYPNYYARQAKHNNANVTRVLEPKKLPPWLMKQYYWDSMMTHNYYDADMLDSIVPGLGMLANSHPGMVLADNMGPARPTIGGYRSGSSTPYQDQAFEALKDIPAGHEIFVEYGDSWFEDRFPKFFGLSKDYKAGNKLAERWQTEIINAHYDPLKFNMWRDLSTLVLDTIRPSNQRLHDVMRRLNFLPTAGDKHQPFEAAKNPTAYASVPTAPQSLEWLQQEGLCLDHITVSDSKVAPGESGAFASRFLPRGTVVAPAPVVHMSRDHLAMFILDEHDSDIVLWKGHQLLLNYVYGHVESSLLFFPYAPAVNLINHYKSRNNKNSQTQQRPNVKLQWSSKMPHPEWLESWTPDQVLEESEKAGLVMEIVALEDIPEGAEIVLDYGQAWQSSYEEHMATTPPPPHLPPIDWNPPQLLTINDKQRYPPYAETVCWIHEDQHPVEFFNLAHGDKRRIPDQWNAWKATPHFDYLSDTMPCTIVGKTHDGAFYNVLVKDMVQIHHDDEPKGQAKRKRDEVEVEIKIAKIPREGVTIVPKMYIGAEMRRDAFRHEIQLPDQMVPEHWRDLKKEESKEVEQEQCNLYMAESAIPNAGWGLYRGYAHHLASENTYELDRFCEDMVIHVEDFAMNQMLRNRYLKQEPDQEMDEWPLSSFAWSGEMTKGGNLEAETVLAFAPGCGMLANSHPMAYNSHRLAAQRITPNHTDPSFGATTAYHHNLFVEQYMKKGDMKIRTLSNGMEILVNYGDAFFQRMAKHEEVPIPLRSDYINVDKVLRRLRVLKEKFGDQAGDALWKLLWHTVEVFDLKRIASVLPKDFTEAPKVLEAGGSALYTMPDRIRTPEWLEKHGSCVDNIQPGQSTVGLAGKGAFATRAIGKGKVVAPVPLIHLHRQHLDVFDSDHIDDPSVPVFWVGKQLLMNYVYGHPESSLLLFPYSPVVNYVNHASSKDGRANAKLQWSTTSNSQDWLDKSPEELLRKHKRAGLAMEIVALRDIAPGEEIFIDYQSHWEDAWKSHTESYKLPGEWGYEPPNNQWLDWVSTENEILDHELIVQYDRDDKYLGCHVPLPADLPAGIVEDEDLLQFEWRQADGMFRTTKHVYPCEIIERVVDADDPLYAKIRQATIAPLHQNYAAIITVPQGPDRQGKAPKRFISFNMPRRAIEIFDAEYASPQFHRKAFRHEIGIPDDIFPKAWRDLKR